MGKNFCKLSPDDIDVDAVYQRDLDEPRAEAIATRFDQSRVGVPVLSLRKNGTYVVLDGQHRLEGMRRAGLGNQKILCEVHNGLSVTEEAELFLKLNGGRKQVDVHNRWKARIVAKEPVALEITAIVESLGLRIGRSFGKNIINAVQALESTHRRARNLESTLLILKKWGVGDRSSLDGELIKDMSRFLLDYSGELNADELVSKLSRIDPMLVLRRIKALAEAIGRNRRLAANTVLCEYYNHRRTAKDKPSPVG